MTVRIPYDQLDGHPDASDYCTLRDEPFTGTAYSIWSDGSVCQEWSFRAGEKWGPQRRWHSNGQLTNAGYYVAGFVHGVYRKWRPDGRKLRVTVFQYGIQVRSRGWDERGQASDDYYVEDEGQARWYLAQIEEGREKVQRRVDGRHESGECSRALSSFQVIRDHSLVRRRGALFSSRRPGGILAETNRGLLSRPHHLLTGGRVARR